MARVDRIGKHETAIIRDNGSVKVKYHYTNVVEFSPSSIILRNNGYLTTTTKLRMNQTSNHFNLGFYVYQQDYEWFIVYQGKTYDFYDGIELSRN